MSRVYPELLHGRADEPVPRPWRVHPGSTRRGGASCDLGARVLEVPLEVGATARVVRAHELMHARVSPRAEHFTRELDEVAARALECAEEFRVNSLLARVGFDLTLLRDGSEKDGARRVAAAGDWPEAVCFLLAVLDTGGERDFFNGLRAAQPSWAPPLRALKRRVLALRAAWPTPLLGATTLDEDGRPTGFARCTLVLARLCTQTMVARVPRTPEELRAFRRSLEEGARRPPTGRFAPLVLLDFDTAARRRRVVRAPRATTTGTTLRYPGRLLTDDQRRAFATPSRRRGGVVVIDQSGSMDVDPDDLTRLVRHAPEAFVVGYSHRPGDRGATPNAWVLARDGRIAPTRPAGNVGNGVDGPVLRWALRQRRRGDVLVWVTDGQITDAHDYPDASLSAECASLVRGHRIRLARDVLEAANLLGRDRALSDERLSRFGRLGRALGEARGV